MLLKYFSVFKNISNIFVPLTYTSILGNAGKISHLTRSDPLLRELLTPEDPKKIYSDKGLDSPIITDESPVMNGPQCGTGEAPAPVRVELL